MWLFKHILQNISATLQHTTELHTVMQLRGVLQGCLQFGYIIWKDSRTYCAQNPVANQSKQTQICHQTYESTYD